MLNGLLRLIRLLALAGLWVRIAVVTIGFSPAGLLADECEKLPAPAVVIKRLEEKISLNFQYGYRSLTNIGAGSMKPGSLVLGLTRGNASVQFSSQTPGYVDQSGRWECISPQITLTYGFSPMTVYVAREFPEGSCAYKEIYEHELRHVKAYQSHIAAIEKDIGEMLTRRFTTGDVWRGPVGWARTRLQQELEERWVPYVQREIKRVDAAQALIDTPEEYERLANSCDGAVTKATR